VDFTISANATGLERTHSINAKYQDYQGNITDYYINITQNA